MATARRAIIGTRMLPSDEEVLALVPGPGSVTWRWAADLRNLLAAGYALVLQVAHPTVGIAVAEHSDYRNDPWDRLLRTLDFTNALVYAEPAVAGAVARELRSRHARIRGTKPDGTGYHALEPAAFAWVWASLYDAIVAAHRHFGDALRGDREEQLWIEWRRLGRLLGVRERDLPATLDGYGEYFDATVHEVLVDNDTVQGVLGSIGRPACPRSLRYLGPAWRLGTLPGAHTLGIATAGLLPGVLRERFGLRWTLAQELELRALGAASRAAAPLVPKRLLRALGPSYLSWRGERHPLAVSAARSRT
jgi:uncharacterized protein (DUF2236 family)